jgi:hypothetical protein
MSIVLTIVGQVELIKSEKEFQKTFLTEFIVSVKNGERSHLYIIKSFSPGAFDKYSIHTLIGKDVSIDCYLNGRKSIGKSGDYYNNELHVKEMRLV